MAETYFQSLQRENREYALQVATLEAEVQRQRILLDSQERIIDSLDDELREERHKVNGLLKGEKVYG